MGVTAKLRSRPTDKVRGFGREIGDEFTARFKRARGEDPNRNKKIGIAAAAGIAGVGAGAILIRRLLGDDTHANDQHLADRVRSELFRPADAPKGSVNVNVEEGVVYLRGLVDERRDADKLVDKTKDIEGVDEVKNLLHTPGEPARMN